VTAGPFRFTRVDARLLGTAATPEDEDLEVVAWYPTRDATGLAPDGPSPLVLLSHGCGGLPDVEAFLAEHLATFGFVVAGPVHPGNSAKDCEGCACGMSGVTRRPGDLILARDRVVAEGDGTGRWLGVVDPDRVAVAGHSNGGWAALEVAARAAGIKAVVALAPAQIETAAEAIHVPAMVAVGGFDGFAPWDREVFGRLARPRYLFELQRAGHETFTDAVDIDREDRQIPHDDAHRRINGVVTALLFRHVLGDERYATALESGGDAEMTLTAEVGP
jgi:predicted dienelactone hydrolase